MNGKTMLLGIAVIFLAAALFFIFGGQSENFESISGESDIVIYKSSSCGCCDIYVNYFRKNGNKNVRAVNVADMNKIKAQYGVPRSMESCHTTIIGGYFVEGHVPLEVIEKLVSEKPDIKGIAMPGMPSGSPGMPGVKSGDFIIYGVDNEGGYSEWMRI